MTLAVVNSPEGVFEIILADLHLTALPGVEPCILER